MALLDLFRREKALTASPAVVEALQSGQLTTYRRLGGVNQQVNAAWLQSQSASYAFMYERQPAVRKVVDYIARNVSQLGLKLYERQSDTERRRDTDHPAFQTMANPNSLGPSEEFIFGFLADFLVHDNAYALKFRGANDGPRVLIRVPPPAVGVNSSGRYTVDSYRIWRSDGTYFDVEPSDVVHWRGYNPSDPRIGVSRLETLRQILAEETAAQAASVELMKSGLAKPGYIKRPLEAPEWSQDARRRFEESWANRMKASARKTPVLEEGMEFADFGVTPKDAEMLDGRRFTNEEVASLYGMAHCPPQGEDERRQFYADVLPPITQAFAAQLDFSLLREEFAEDDYYFEFDLNEKLRGDLENRFQSITASTGRPWLTVNEARARENLSAIEGGDELTIPLNVVLGDNPRPAPNVMPPQDPNGPPQDGSHREAALEAPETKQLVHPRQAAVARRRDGYADEFKALLVRHYERQERAIKSAERGKAVPTSRWQKWDGELSDDLEELLRRTVETEGDVAAHRFGLAGFDTRLVRNYLRAQAEDVAKGINRATREALAGAEAAEVFERAKSERAPVAALSIATTAATFAAREAAKQSPDADRRTKTWIVTTGNSFHPEMNGETVPLGSTFSNGADGPPADHPGCQCVMEIT